MSLLQISVSGVKEFQQFAKLFPQTTDRALRDAINGGADFAFASASREIRKQVNFPQSYLGSAKAGNRLKISRRATETSPVAIISARKRATSLARFVMDRKLTEQKGVRVAVKPGAAKRMTPAFLIRLRKGASLTEDEFNLGLAIRLKPGQTLIGKKKPISGRDPNLFLLYGPSVDQVFSTVRDDITPEVDRFIGAEFFRQFARYNV